RHLCTGAASCTEAAFPATMRLHRYARHTLEKRCGRCYSRQEQHVSRLIATTCIAWARLPGNTNKEYALRLMYDLIVIGGGPAGSSAAITAAQAGAKVFVL